MQMMASKRYKNLPPPFDPYQTDPKRDPELVVQAAKPFNAETPLPRGVKSIESGPGRFDSRLVFARSQLAKQEFLTPTEKFFVRNHLPVPTGAGKASVSTTTSMVSHICAQTSLHEVWQAISWIPRSTCWRSCRERMRRP